MVYNTGIIWLYNILMKIFQTYFSLCLCQCDKILSNFDLG